MKIILLIFCFILSSCATGYKPNGWSGGYSEIQLSENMYKVSFNGNGFTHSQIVENYLLKRCAQLTLIQGYTHFLIVSNDSSVDSSIQQSYEQFNVVNKHTGYATIKMINEPDKSLAAFDAEIIYGPLELRKPASLKELETRLNKME